VHRDESLALTIVYERVERGQIQATIPAVPGPITTGRTRAEARSNVRDALCTMLTTEPTAALASRDTEQLELTIGRTRTRNLDRDVDR
jgi:predicted RNase H-like HicB family nuclease